MKIAILVDGGFYRKRAKRLFGDKLPKDRAKELNDYCLKHVHKNKGDELYRIFYVQRAHTAHILPDVRPADLWRLT